MKNKDGNEIGVVIEADDLLTQLAKARVAKKQKPKRRTSKPKKVSQDG